MLVDTSKFPYKVKIPWRKGDTINRWDIICIECVNSFGLPGDKYMTATTADDMVFYFKDEKNAIIFNLAAL